MIKRILVAIVFCIFFASFFLPAYAVAESAEAAEPIAIFLSGWLGLFSGSTACVAWLANPLFFVAAILFLRNRRRATVVGLLAFLFAASFLFARSIINDEAGHYAKITGYKAGYWLWLGSIGILLCTIAIWSAIKSTKKSDR